MTHFWQHINLRFQMNGGPFLGSWISSCCEAMIKRSALGLPSTMITRVRRIHTMKRTSWLRAPVSGFLPTPFLFGFRGQGAAVHTLHTKADLASRFCHVQESFSAHLAYPTPNFSVQMMGFLSSQRLVPVQSRQFVPPSSPSFSLLEIFLSFSHLLSLPLHDNFPGLLPWRS